MLLKELNFVKPHFLIPYLNYVKDNRKVFQATLSHPEAFKADERYRRLYKHISDPILEKFNVPQERRLYYNAFYLNGMIAVVQEWLRKDCKEDVTEVSDIIEGLVTREK